MTKSVSAIFLDRDGTINIDYGYIYRINEFKFIEGVIDAMYELKMIGYNLIIVTNQSGIARGKFTETQFKILTKWMNQSLFNRGINLDGIYYCPHHPQGYIKKYKKTCYCRKPNSGMLESAQARFQINMASSFMIGDKLEDMQAANAAGIGMKVLIHKNTIHSNSTMKKAKKTADWIITNLSELPKKIKNINNSIKK